MVSTMFAPAVLSVGTDADAVGIYCRRLCIPRWSVVYSVVVSLAAKTRTCNRPPYRFKMRTCLRRLDRRLPRREIWSGGVRARCPSRIEARLPVVKRVSKTCTGDHYLRRTRVPNLLPKFAVWSRVSRTARQGWRCW